MAIADNDCGVLLSGFHISLFVLLKGETISSGWALFAPFVAPPPFVAHPAWLQLTFIVQS
jgi:hypothetical protein